MWCRPDSFKESLKQICDSKLTEIRGFREYKNDPICRLLEIGDPLAIYNDKNPPCWKVISYDHNLNLFIAKCDRTYYMAYIVSLHGKLYKSGLSCHNFSETFAVERYKQKIKNNISKRIIPDLSNIIITYL